MIDGEEMLDANDAYSENPMTLEVKSRKQTIRRRLRKIELSLEKT
jgi:hypothetical protein